MTEQTPTSGTTNSSILPGSIYPAAPLPAEGRSDIAESLEEEQRDAYSAHQTGTAAKKQGRPPRPQPGQQHGTPVPSADPGLTMPPPVEGRPDVAESVEEEQRNAYSSRNKNT
jgi:hypothetical protein